MTLPATQDDAISEHVSAEIIALQQNTTPQFEAALKKQVRLITPRVRKELDKAAAETIRHASAAAAEAATRELKEAAAKAETELRNFGDNQARAAYAHGFHKAAWMIGLPAFIIAGALVGIAITWQQATVFDRAVEAASMRDMTDAIVQRARNPDPQ